MSSDRGEWRKKLSMTTLLPRRVKSTGNDPLLTSSRFSISPSAKAVQFNFRSSDDFSNDGDEADADPENANFALRHGPAIESQPIVKSETSPSFSKLMATVYGCILQDSLEQTDIMIEINNLPPTDVNLEYISMEDLYGTHIQYYDGRMNSQFYGIDYLKFKKDVWFMRKVVELTLENLRDNKRDNVLVDAVRNYDYTRSDEEDLLNAKRFNLKHFEKLKKMFENERNTLSKDVLKITTNVGNLKDELNDLMTQVVTQNNFITNYERARREQNQTILRSKEKDLREEEETYTQNLTQEERIHAEIENYMEILDKEDHEAIQYWMTRYEEDYDKMDLNISKIKMLIQKKREDYEGLKKEYEKRVTEIDEYLEHKRIKKLEAEELELRNYAATRIQAWWRGTMYRRGLGPWRKKKKGKGKKRSAKSSKSKK